MTEKTKKTKERTYSIRFTDRNKSYLKTLQYIDGRNNSISSKRNLNEFVNKCITDALESQCLHSERISGQKATPKQLEKAYIKFLVAQKNSEIQKISEEITKLTQERQIKSKPLDMMEMV